MQWDLGRILKSLLINSKTIELVVFLTVRESLTGQPQEVDGMKANFPPPRKQNQAESTDKPREENNYIKSVPEHIYC